MSNYPPPHHQYPSLSDLATPSSEHPQDYYSSTTNFVQSDYSSPHDDQNSLGNLRRDIYPPTSNQDYEKAVNPVTRGSIAAQMAAEGQIPKKEGLRMWRSDEHAGALMKGGRLRCCGRVCCCSIILVILILVSIVAAFLLWVRPPDITFLGVEEPQNGTSEVTVQTNGFLINFDLDIRVINPNFFGATFKEITATAFYPTNKTQSIGGGQMTHVKIPKYSNDTLHFPFTIDYTTTIDPGLLIVTDIATKCGFLGTGGTEDLTVDYTIKLGLNIAGVIISPSFSSSASFACPLTESEVAGFLGSSGLSGLTSSLGTRSQHEDFAWDEKRRWAEDLMKLLKRI